MKRYFSVLTAVVLFSSFGIYILNSHHGKPISDSFNIPTSNIQQIEKSNDSSDNNQCAQIKKLTLINKSEKTYYALNKKEHNIGSSNTKGGNSPENHVFQVLINHALLQNYQVWLDYELYGLEDFTSVCKSVNDQPSVGGTFVKKLEAWSKQSEQLKPEQIRTGKNIIRFNVPENADYSYKVRNVALRIVPTNKNQARTLVINQPSTFTYYQKFGYLQGFVVGKGSEKAKLSVNGKSVQSLNGIFESIVEKDGITANIWSANIVARFEDGEEITQNVIFDKPAQFDFTYNLNNQIHQSEATFLPKNPITLQHDGMKIEGLPQTIVTATTITATTLRAIDMPPLGSGMVNVTGMGKGYRLLPHGSKFQKDLTIRMKYDTTQLPIGYKPEDIYTYYFDETANNWIVLPRDTIDIVNCEIVSYTNHFTDFINGIIKAPEMPETQAYTPTSIKDIKAANPLEGYNTINPPSANNMGTANLSFPIEIPTGRNGMQPNLSINYSSGGGNSWLGVGWNLSTPSITVETRWGVPRYDGSLETESYLLNGEELIPQVQRTGFEARTTDKQFFLKVEGAFSKIIRHGSNPTNYYWTVTDKSGLESTYGDINDSRLTDNASNIAHWSITKIKDLNGNFISYKYQVLTHGGVSLPTNSGKQIYLKKILYTNSNNIENGKYWVDFNLEDIDDVLRPDIQISGRLGFKEVTAHRLKNIVVSSNWGIIRKYHMVYKEGAFNKTLLCTILEENRNSETINGEISNDNLICGGQTRYFSIVGVKVHHFDYFDDIPNEHFTTEKSITAYDDDLHTHTIFGSPSAIGNTRSWDWGAGLGVGVGFGSSVWKNNNSICGRYNYSKSYTRGLSMLMDINGDGLPDKVFYDDEKVYFRSLKKDGTEYAFGEKQQVFGITNMLTESSSTHSIGLDGHIGLSERVALNVAGAFSRTETYTDRYFADADGDGVPDFIDNGTVYYNKNINGTINYVANNSDTIWVGQGHCNFILNTGTIDPSIVSTDEPIFSFCDTIIDKRTNDTVINCYDNSDLHEAVRIWIAPWDGHISINC